jgi:hypothetical protein
MSDVNHISGCQDMRLRLRSTEGRPMPGGRDGEMSVTTAPPAVPDRMTGPT